MLKKFTRWRGVEEEKDAYAAGVLAPPAIDSHIVNTNLPRKEQHHTTALRSQTLASQTKEQRHTTTLEIISAIHKRKSSHNQGKVNMSFRDSKFLLVDRFAKRLFYNRTQMALHPKHDHNLMSMILSASFFDLLIFENKCKASNPFSRGIIKSSNFPVILPLFSRIYISNTTKCLSLMYPSHHAKDQDSTKQHSC